MPTDIVEHLQSAKKQELDPIIGTPTINHRIELIRTEIEIGQAVFETAGDPVPRSPFVRSSAANCSPQAIQETLSIQVSESQTTSWSFSSEVSLTETSELTIGGDLIVAGASVGGSVAVGVKVNTQVAGSSTKQVALTDSVTVTVPPNKRSVIRGQTWSTPVTGSASGHIIVRYWHQYTLDHTWPISNTESIKVQTISRIPFSVSFRSELITFTKVVREEDVDCGKVGLYIPGEEGFGQGTNHPMYATALWPADVFPPPLAVASLASVSPVRYEVRDGAATDQPPAEWQPPAAPPPLTTSIEIAPVELTPVDREALSTVLRVARESADEFDLSRKLGWGEAELTTAKYVLKRAREGINLETAEKIRLVREGLLRRPTNL